MCNTDAQGKKATGLQHIVTAADLDTYAASFTIWWRYNLIHFFKNDIVCGRKFQECDQHL